MSRISKILGPKSASGSLIWSLGVHLAVAGGVVGYHKLGGQAAPPSEEYVDLSYEVFEEPPPPEEEVRPVARTTQPVVQPEEKTPIDHTPRELQDENSEVAGTQEAKVAPNVGATNGSGNAASTPYYKIKPKYPKAALLAGVEGWVLMEIDVNEQGAVENVRVIDGEQRSMFQSEAKRAVSLYKYRPFTDESGNPVRKENHQVRVEFKLEEQASM